MSDKLLRYVFELKVVERVDAVDEEEARGLLERGEEWELINVIDIPENQRG